MSGDYQLEDTIYLPFTTRAFATGIPTTLAGTPAIDIYEDATATPIVTGETLATDVNSVAGFNIITVTATAASGFNAGGFYTAIIQAGTVGGVSVVGEVVATFTIDASAAAVDLANGTDGLGAIKAETALIVADTNELQTDDIPGLIATAQADLDTITGSDGVTLATVQALYAPSKAGDSMALTAAAVDAIIDETLTSHVTADSLGVAIKDILADTNELQTDDVPGLIAALNDVAATDIVSAGAITTLAGAVVNVDTVDTTTTNSDMRGTDNAALATELAKVPKSDGTSSWNATALAAINAEADTAISDASLATAANLATVDTNVDNLNLGIIYGTAQTGTLSTTQATTDLSGYLDDELIGRVIIFTGGTADGQASDITDYAAASGLVTFTAITTAPVNGDTFKIV